MISRKKRQKFCFAAGCIALTCAILSLTVFPLVINNYMPKIFVPVLRYKFYALVFYVATIGFFLFSRKYTAFQIKWIIITAVYYIVFQIFVKLFL